MQDEILKNIHSPADVKALPEAELPALAEELRAELIRVVTHNGGHLASNLGVVELTIALHRVFDCPKDILVFDVGHQAYVHKLLTGRAERFSTLRTKDGLSGFPKRAESAYDAFDTGHSSTSISAALGYLHAAALKGEQRCAVAVIGDGALTGGMAFEALNDAGQSALPMVVVLNDNRMSISRNVGALSGHLNKLRSSPGYQRLKTGTKRRLHDWFPKSGEELAARLRRLRDRIKYFLLPQHMLFEEMGFKYWGPVDGHDIPMLEEVLSRARDMGRPVIVHVLTKKGKGYTPAEQMPEKFHSTAPQTGVSAPKGRSNAAVFGETLCEIAREEPRLAVVCAAMPIGTGVQDFHERFPERCFDVGIAEQHAVTMAAAMAADGIRPVVAIYSTFLQRAYDQILHDVCLQSLPVVFGVDRAGLVGEDGETHQGVYDVCYMFSMPILQLWSPATQQELRAMLRLALAQNGPVAIRYGRTPLPEGVPVEGLTAGKWEMLRPVRPVTVLACGRMVGVAEEACKGLDVGLVNARFMRPMDEDVLAELRRVCTHVVTVEDALASGGFGAHIMEKLPGIAVECIGVPEAPVTQGKVCEQDADCGMDAAHLRARLLRRMEDSI